MEATATSNVKGPNSKTSKGNKEIAINPHSKILTKVFRDIKKEHGQFHAIMSQIKSSHGKNVSSMIKVVLLTSSKENPLPLKLIKEKMETAILNEASVVYTPKIKATLNKLLDKFLEVFMVYFSEAAESSPADEAVLTFCTTIVQMHLTLDVKDFQNQKEETIKSFMDYFKSLSSEVADVEIHEEVHEIFEELGAPSAN